MEILFKILIYSGIFIITFRVLRYLTTPLFKKIGIYNYYSNMFFTVSIFYKLKEIHLGTSWDFFKIRKVNPKKLLIYLAEGLTNLSTDVENGYISPDTTFRGIIYYMKPKTIENFGFKVQKLNIVDMLLFGINYFELCFLISLSRKKLSYVKLNNISRIKCKAYELIRNKCKYEDILAKLNRDNELQHYHKKYYPIKKSA